MVRSIGRDVEQSGLSFIWLPGSNSFLVRELSQRASTVMRRTSFILESSQVNPLYFHACIASCLSGHNLMDLPRMFGSRRT